MVGWRLAVILSGHSLCAHSKLDAACTFSSLVFMTLRRCSVLAG